MHSNLWNLRSGNQRLQIIEKTQAHKRHLINLMNAKTKIDTHSNSTPRRVMHSPISLTRQHIIRKDNIYLSRKLSAIGHSPPNMHNHSNLSRSLKVYSSLNRSIRQREIQEENNKMLTRLVTASPTIRRQQWQQRQIQTSKYKENLARSKYSNPDYSREACKLIQAQPKFHCLIKLNFSERNNKSKLMRRPKIL